MTDLVVGESTLIDDSLSDYEAMRTFFQVAEERGHPSPSVVVDERGQAITHPDYIDRMGAAHVRAGAWAFCRRLSVEALGRPSGSEWARMHTPHLMFSGGSPYRSTPHFQEQLYLQRFDSTEPQMLIPMCAAGPVAWSNDGSRICVLETRLGHLTDGTRMAGWVLWEYEMALGTRRRIVGFPIDPDHQLGLVELSYSPDNRWIHICDWASGRNRIARAADGLIVPLPLTSAAVSWNPRAGASMMIVIVPDQESGNLVIHDYDLSSDQLSPRAEIRSPTGLPLPVRELSMSMDELGLVTAPIGTSAIDQLRRGGVHVATVIDIDAGKIHTVLPPSYQTPGAQRRHTSPRWCEDRAAYTPSQVRVADRLIEAGYALGCEPDGPTIASDDLRRWLESMDGVEAAWRARSIPRAMFAQDFAQLAISCEEIDPEATGKVLASVREQADRDPIPRAVLRWISNGHYRLGSPLDSLPSPPGGEAAAAHAEPPPSAQASATDDAIEEALGGLVAAENRTKAVNAVQQLLFVGHRAGQPAERIWDWLASRTSATLGRGGYLFVAKVGLGTLVWNGFYLQQDPSIGDYGLGPTPPAAELPLLLDCFEACTHLPEREVLGSDGHMIFDVETARNWCQAGLSRLSLDEHLIAARPKRPTGAAPAVRNPAIRHRPEAEGHRVRKKRVFISYVREDAEAVDRIAVALRDGGADVWIDRTNILAGEPWELVIRRAIRDGDYFVACFSPSSAERERSYMRKELWLAIEELQLRPHDRRWFIPIILEPCSIPDIPIGGIQTLEKLQYLDFSQEWDTAIKGLLMAVSAGATDDVSQ